MRNFSLFQPETLPAQLEPRRFDRRRRELRVSDGRDGKPISARLKKDSVLAKTLDHDGEF